MLFFYTVKPISPDQHQDVTKKWSVIPNNMGSLSFFVAGL
jgi:hypothetical protein